MQEASTDLEADKIATQEDAVKVLKAELRNSPTGQRLPGGVAAAIRIAADINDTIKLIEATQGAFPSEDVAVPDQEHAPTPGAENVPKPATGEGKVHAKEE